MSQRKIALFAGTTEGRQLALALCGRGLAVTACVATGWGRSLLEEGQPETLAIREGRMDAHEMRDFLQGGGFFAAVDATHPYAREVSENLRAACEAACLPCLRLRREETPLPGCRLAEDIREAAALCQKMPGSILLATGAKELPDFCRALGPGGLSRLYPRVLPVEESIRRCREAGIPAGHIIAMQGPFSRELNLALMRQFSISVLVTKDGGSAGGMPEKLAAARQQGVSVVVIRRPEEPGRSFTAEEITAFLCKE